MVEPHVCANVQLGSQKEKEQDELWSRAKVSCYGLGMYELPLRMRNFYLEILRIAKNHGPLVHNHHVGLSHIYSSDERI